MHRIKASLCNATIELKQLETNIARTQRRLESLCARRDELHDHTNRYRIAIAPYKCLPPEILRTIFVACLPESVYLPPRPDEAPLLLTRICSSWRELALGTQELWCHFEVMLSTRAWKNNNALTSLREWLNRCPDRELSFKVNTAPRAPFPLPGLRHPILPVDLIIPHTLRIRKLEMQNISGEQMSALITLPLGSFPLLEEVNVFLRDSWMFRMEPWEATAFRDARKLTSVSICGFDGTFNPAALGLPWDQLRVLHVDTLLNDPTGCHAMLKLCAQLQEVSLRVMRIEDSTSRLIARLPPTHLPHLRTLLIRFESTAYHGKFIEPFELPSLHTLQTRFDWRHDALGLDDAANCYAELISRSACPIQRLYIGRNSSELDLEKLLVAGKEVRELILGDHVQVPGAAWDRMGRGEVGGKLERLGMSVAAVDPLLVMLETKMGSHAMNGNNISASVGTAVYPCPPLDLDTDREGVRVLKEIKLGCPRLTFQQKWRMECLEKLGLKFVICHYGFFEH